MNERIRELALQAGFSTWVLNPSKETMSDTPELLKKFAELIVQECLLSLEPDLYSKEIDYEFEQRFYKRCRAKIVKHFGIKE